MQRMSGIAHPHRRVRSRHRLGKDRLQGDRRPASSTRARPSPACARLDKYAVCCGGGLNHRLDLQDGILIKNNHIALGGGLPRALEHAFAGRKPGQVVQVEVRSPLELQQAIAGAAESILLDNMTPSQVKKSVKLIRQALPKATIEASGNMNLKTVRSYAKTGVDFISVGALTHSATAVDLSMKIVANSRQLSRRVPTETFDLREVEQVIAGTEFSGYVKHFATVVSTNDLALAAAQTGARHGVWIADEQTAGRGRGNHTWHSAPGEGLYLTALISPAIPMQSALRLSFTTAIAVQSAIASVTSFRIPDEIDIRWPNDLLLHGRKCGGILIETAAQPAPAAGPAMLRHAVIGIGINVNHLTFPQELDPIATSLRRELATPAGPIRREPLAAAILIALDTQLAAPSPRTPNLEPRTFLATAPGSPTSASASKPATPTPAILAPLPD